MADETTNETQSAEQTSTTQAPTLEEQIATLQQSVESLKTDNAALKESVDALTGKLTEYGIR